MFWQVYLNDGQAELITDTLLGIVLVCDINIMNVSQ